MKRASTDLCPKTLRWVGRAMTSGINALADSRDDARRAGRELVAQCRQSDVETLERWRTWLRIEATRIERQKAGKR